MKQGSINFNQKLSEETDLLENFLKLNNKYDYEDLSEGLSNLKCSSPIFEEMEPLDFHPMKRGWNALSDAILTPFQDRYSQTLDSMITQKNQENQIELFKNKDKMTSRLEVRKKFIMNKQTLINGHSPKTMACPSPSPPREKKILKWNDDLFKEIKAIIPFIKDPFTREQMLGGPINKKTERYFSFLQEGNNLDLIKNLLNKKSFSKEKLPQYIQDLISQYEKSHLNHKFHHASLMNFINTYKKRQPKIKRSKSVEVESKEKEIDFKNEISFSKKMRGKSCYCSSCGGKTYYRIMIKICSLPLNLICQRKKYKLMIAYHHSKKSKKEKRNSIGGFLGVSGLQNKYKELHSPNMASVKRNKLSSPAKEAQKKHDFLQTQFSLKKLKTIDFKEPENQVEDEIPEGFHLTLNHSQKNEGDPSKNGNELNIPLQNTKENEEGRNNGFFSKDIQIVSSPQAAVNQQSKGSDENKLFRSGTLVAEEEKNEENEKRKKHRLSSQEVASAEK